MNKTGPANRKTVFVLFGEKGTGKSTAAKAIRRALKDVKIDSFAAPLYEMVGTLTGRTVARLKEHKEDPRFGVGGRSPRELLQTLGTEWGRDLVNAHLWADLAVSRVQRATQEIVVFDDGRFPVEEGPHFSSALQQLGHTTHLIRIRCPRRERDLHASENALDAFSAYDSFVTNEMQGVPKFERAITTAARCALSPRRD